MSNQKLEVSIPGLTLIIGLQGSGKSTLIRYIMHANRKKFSYGLVFCNTAFSGDSFDYVYDKWIHPEFNENALVSLMNIQKKEREKHTAFVIFDDAIFGAQWKNEKFKQLITQLRHYNIWCCISSQYPHAIPPTLRSNAFNCFMFCMGTENALKALYESYGMFFNSFNEFKNYLLKNTGSYQFIHFDARNTSSNIAEKYHVMKIKNKIPKFTIETK